MASAYRFLLYHLLVVADVAKRLECISRIVRTPKHSSLVFLNLSVLRIRSLLHTLLLTLYKEAYLDSLGRALAYTKASVHVMLMQSVT